MDYLHILEFDKIKEMLAGFAVTEKAKARIAALEPSLSETTVRRALNDTTAGRKILGSCGNPPAILLDGMDEMLTVCEKGGMLLPEQLTHMMKFCASCKRLKAYLKKAEITGEALAFGGSSIDTLEKLYSEINRCITDTSVNSEASRALSDARRAIDNTNLQIRARLEEMLKAKKEYYADSFVSMRNGRFTLPVKKEYKNQVPGTVVALSSTGGTCFIEPVSVAKLVDKLNALKIEEELETEKILYALSVMVDHYSIEINTNKELIEELDFVFAKAKLSNASDAVAPTLTTERRITIEQGRHPLLNRDTCVPLDFRIGDDITGIIITGPNTGGKTVSLKLVGLFTAMAQCGLHLPCKSAEVCLTGNILCDIGDGQSISQNLSTFSAHITNVCSILKNTTSESLVLLDELGSGTDPAEGMGIAIATLEELRRRHCLFVATTHYAEVKTYAEKAEGLINARMTFDRETLQPRYRLIIGEAGESCALYIAKRLGFPEKLLKMAYEQCYSGKTEVKSAGDESFYETLSDKEIENDFVMRVSKTPKPKELSEHAARFAMGDSVMVYPTKEIGIVYKPSDADGFIVVQIKGEKRRVNHRRIKLKQPACELYPPDYDFSIIFDTVENRKARHSMERKFDPNAVIKYEPEV